MQPARRNSCHEIPPVRITYEDAGPYYAPEYLSHIVCSGDLTRFVETDFDGSTSPTSKEQPCGA
jgi:hypothetical protein